MDLPKGFKKIKHIHSIDFPQSWWIFPWESKPNQLKQTQSLCKIPLNRIKPEFSWLNHLKSPCSIIFLYVPCIFETRTATKCWSRWCRTASSPGNRGWCTIPSSVLVTNVSRQFLVDIYILLNNMYVYIWCIIYIYVIMYIIHIIIKYRICWMGL